MTAAALKAKPLPNYTKTEELMNTISHAIGIALGFVALITCLIASKDSVNITGSIIYGISMILMYSVSSLYHGMSAESMLQKQVMRIVDHCMIFIFIAGSYAPVILNVIYRVSPVKGIVMLSLIWAAAIAGTVFNMIDLDKYSKLSMACYLILGWFAIFIIKPLVAYIGLSGVIYLISGGISYSIGAVLYGIGKKKRYMHFIFHIFVVIGTALQYVCILNYIIK